MDFAAKRQLLCKQLQNRGITSERVLSALNRIPREKFVPTELWSSAYYDQALPIAVEQTISQPYIVALMTQCLNLTGTDNVLEIGTGSGYQAAILSLLAREVVSVERLEALSAAAQDVLRNLGSSNISFVIGDGTLGWPDGAPYDAIIVTAAAPEVPPALLEQLSDDGGRMVIPVGDEAIQNLMLIKKQDDTLTSESLGGCRFVKLLGEQGWHH